MRIPFASTLSRLVPRFGAESWQPGGNVALLYSLALSSDAPADVNRPAFGFPVVKPVRSDPGRLHPLGTRCYVARLVARGDGLAIMSHRANKPKEYRTLATEARASYAQRNRDDLARGTWRLANTWHA